MKEKKQFLKNAITIIVFTVLFVYFVNHTSVITKFFARILSISFPLIVGCVIAFVINMPMKGIEAKLFKNPNGKFYKARRPISMVLAYILAIAFIAVVFVVMIPELGRTVDKIQDKLPGFIENAKNWITKYTEKYPQIQKEIDNFDIDLSQIGNLLLDNGNTILSTTVGIFSSIISTIVNVLIGIIFSIYILSQKETLGRQLRMVCYTLFKESTADELMVFGKIANNTFAKFLYCQFREGLILGSMFVVAMLILRLPFALTIGIIIAFTALIPVFGAFIGLFIGALLILVDTPSKVIVFVILFFVLQNTENYLIYPKLVGGDVGLPPIWVLFAVVVGGDLMGVIGMFVFIPLVSVIYMYGRSIVTRKLKNNNINVDEKIPPDDVIPIVEGRRRTFGKKAEHHEDVETLETGEES